MKLILKMALIYALSCVAVTTMAQTSATSSPGGLAITALDRLSKTTYFGGYFDTEWKSSGKENSFVAHRLVLQTSAQPHPALLFNTEIEFEYGGAVNALGNTGEIKIEQAWVDYTLNPFATLRTGLVLVPFGRLNFLHDSDYRETTNRPLVHKYIVPTTWSDAGIGVHGGFEMADIDLTYELYVLNGLTTTASASTGIRSSRPGYKADNSPEKAVAGRLGVVPSVHSEFGFSIYNDTLRGAGADRSKDQALTGYGIDFLYKLGFLELAGEYAILTFSTPKDGMSPDQQDGYYVELRNEWSPKWMTSLIGGDQFDKPTMTWFARLGQVEVNRGGGALKNQTQTTLGVNYRPIKTMAFKAEYEFNRGNLSEGDYDTIWTSVAFGF
ncbi:hypothetical protein EBR57_01875 [bacterium]|nr:hypothetical protein [bacterium]